MTNMGYNISLRSCVLLKMLYDDFNAKHNAIKYFQ